MKSVLFTSALLLLAGSSLAADQNASPQSPAASAASLFADPHADPAHTLDYSLDELAAVEPGTILFVEHLDSFTAQDIEARGDWLFADTGIPPAHTGAELFLLHFRSTDVDGTPTPIRAQLFIPILEEPGERPVQVFAAGTTGVSERCAPIIENPVLNRWGDYRTNMLAYASREIITIFPEYLGFGLPDVPQRYFSKVAEAHVMLDAARAVRNFYASPDKQEIELTAHPAGALFMSGYSQGGHAAHAAADLQPEYAPEIEITGLIGFGQTNDVAMLMREMPYYSPYIIYTYAEIYGVEVIDPADYLLPRWMETFQADIMGLCVEEFQHHYPRNGQDLFTPEFYRALHNDLEGFRMARVFPEMARVLRENRAGFDGHGLPTLVLHGDRDIIVTTPAQDRFVEALRRGGSEVQYTIMPGAHHRHTRQAGFEESVEWMFTQAGLQ
ncbi:lipase family protein [Spirochaeta africana]|uniref:Secretory lipase n=1 Tax=Spirochaeta africana (strain ATCC 700263 / DSM 8902 / Z-7692) TaxID=889378 RepID=H9UGT3_SPIAZ|nr:lipase family protein [Spirochaeta africana]AFG36726.1 Secretory lipase [Spirochaeta africana DSM 8902]